MVGRDVTSRAEPRIATNPSLPFFDRLAPPPLAADLATQIEAWTKPGEIILDLAGRGGWVARAAIGEQRRAAEFESHPLTRLLAEIVLRPPDVRHFDAAIQGLGASAMAGSSVKSTIDALFASRCPGCGRTVVLESLIWESSAGSARAIRREYRCAVCREQLGGPDVRHADPEPGDLELALSVDPRGLAWQHLRHRFPTPGPEHPLPDQLLALHTPRQLLGLHAILDRIEGELRAAPVTAALRLALLQALLPASRLHAYPGRVGAVRIVNGQVRQPTAAQWRERNPWLAFEDGCRLVRGFVQRLESGAQRIGFARFGPDLLALEEGTSNVALSEASPSTLHRLAVQAERIAINGSQSRVRLALMQQPLRWTPERLAGTYHGTAWIFGAEAASLLPFEALFGPAPKPAYEADLSALAASLAVAAPALAPGAHAVVLLDSAAPEALAAAALGGEAAGYRLVDARLHRHDEASAGIVAFVPPGGVMEPGPRTRANRPLNPVPGGTGDPRTIPGRGLFTPPERIDEGPYRPSVAAQVVTDTAVELLKARGEPATFEQLLGDVLIGLDRSGQLARVARPFRPAHDEGFGDPGPRHSAAGGHDARGRSSRDDADDVPDGGEGIHGIDDGGEDGSNGRAPEGLSPERGADGRPDGEAAGGADEAGAAGGGAVEPGAAGGDRETAEARAAAAFSAAGASTVELEPSIGQSPNGQRNGRSPEGSSPGPESSAGSSSADGNGRAAGRGGREPGSGQANEVGPVEGLLGLIRAELDRPNNRRLRQIDPGQYWLAAEEDRASAAAPLADRVEWSVFGLLSTARQLSEATFFERMAGVFRGRDVPDEALLRACLESYRVPGGPESIVCADQLERRSAEHDELVAALADLGHRVGLPVWIGKRLQSRRVHGRPLSRWLDEDERDIHLPLVARGPEEELERVDVAWYVRHRATFFFEVEWTAMIGDPVLLRHARIPTDDGVVRFLVIPPERAELVRFKLARSALLRQALADGNWHILKSNHLRAFAALEAPTLDGLEPYLGLEASSDAAAEQLPLFGG